MRALPWPLAMGAGLASTFCGSPRLESLPAAAVEARLHGAVERREAPAVAAASVRGEGIDLLGAAGTADLAARTPATPDTAWLWFLVTKLITATAVM